MASPLGPLRLAASAEGVSLLAWNRMEPTQWLLRLARAYPNTEIRRDQGFLIEATTQLREYFAGGRREFDVPVDLSACSAFGRGVLTEIRRIPFGEVASYGEVARRVGRPGAARAVGGALGRNPVPILVPCHRVVGSGRSLGGFTGGLARKRRLLRLEGRVLPR